MTRMTATLFVSSVVAGLVAAPLPSFAGAAVLPAPRELLEGDGRVEVYEAAVGESWESTR